MYVYSWWKYSRREEMDLQIHTLTGILKAKPKNINQLHKMNEKFTLMFWGGRSCAVCIQRTFCIFVYYVFKFFGLIHLQLRQAFIWGSPSNVMFYFRAKLVVTNILNCKNTNNCKLCCTKNVFINENDKMWIFECWQL